MNHDTTFDNFISKFDKNNSKIQLKITHTYAVVQILQELTKDKDEKTKKIAYLIGLLHDIGRFLQIEQTNSYDDTIVDHASLSIQYLFDEGHIRDFIKEDTYDSIIYDAIKYHSLYAIPPLSKESEYFALLLRDADKLDHFRVVETEPIESILSISKEDLEKEKITLHIYKEFMQHHLIKKAERKTKMDMWISYIAFIYDLNFPESYQYILDHHYIYTNIYRLQYPADTKIYMDQIYQEAMQYLKEKTSR